ncbi:MAG: DNA alkylation repair protein [Acidobacteriota bacterium]|nr:DNA alkylation repair protein [Acidobacteriota bacterium]
MKFSTAARSLEAELAGFSNPEKATGMARFFKTGKGQYGEGDLFLGVSVPVQRKIALRYPALSLKDVEHLLKSAYHEHRFTALEILVAQYERGTPEVREAVFEFYLAHTACINNWDLVDTSAPYIVGEHVAQSSREVLHRVAVSESLWERRIAIVSTLALIRKGDVEETFRIGEKLLSDKHDLIHKAVGWMLRETGKVSRGSLLEFLHDHHAKLPRTALRYAIERFTPDERTRLMKGEKLAGDFQNSRPR